MNQHDDSRKKKLLANRKAAKITGAFWFLSHTSFMTQPEMEHGFARDASGVPCEEAESKQKANRLI
ncbi:hypothetical protein CI1B_11230 [Bradyrhizobium ivorense]|uniref:Uncharacterized protein n=1 Tax=Bradyrhizobium ivorense TaxID=2511166 RepID=A0A508ST65_9BRAD|nr:MULTISPECIES: hypothetical protein [Bradyrhizobium]VIO66012.1 hypothetical protein CI1B_11230 [Bradyrhizobium ivorense]